jgi:hypothetical protein
LTTMARWHQSIPRCDDILISVIVALIRRKWKCETTTKTKKNDRKSKNKTKVSITKT